MYVPKLTHEQRRERRMRIAEAVRSGKGIYEVAVEFGVCAATVQLACDESSVDPNGMTHNARFEHRRVLAEEVRSGKRPVDVAIEQGAHIQTVYKACQENGVKVTEVRPKPAPALISSERWRGVDWSMRDVDICKLLCVSRGRVRQVRKILCQPKSEYHNVTASGIRLEKWLRSHKNDVSALTIQQITDAVPFKTSYCAVSYACKRIGIEPIKRKRIDEIVTMETLTSFVDVNEQSGCWEWKVACNPNGYGRVGGTDNAHRFVYKLFNGEIPSGKWILHKCDNPKCVNPEHLYAGTPGENSRDREERGRGGSGKTFEAHTVNEIRRRFSAGENATDLAKEYGRDFMTIYRIVRGKTYRDVKDEPQPAVALTA